MTTWTLLIFLAYSGGTGSVALESSRVEFFSRTECEMALTQVAKAIDKNFGRSSLVCVERNIKSLAEKG